MAQPETRDGKSLLKTFPFNQNEQEHHEHADDTLREYKQVAEDTGPGIGFRAVAQVSPGNDGKKCIDKVEMITETEYDDVVTCDHSYDKRCHTSYVTRYDSQQEEECEENYRKI